MIVRWNCIMCIVGFLILWFVNLCVMDVVVVIVREVLEVVVIYGLSVIWKSIL